MYYSTLLQKYVLEYVHAICCLILRQDAQFSGSVVYILCVATRRGKSTGVLPDEPPGNEIVSIDPLVKRSKDANGTCRWQCRRGTSETRVRLKGARWTPPRQHDIRVGVYDESLAQMHQVHCGIVNKTRTSQTPYF